MNIKERIKSFHWRLFPSFPMPRLKYFHFQRNIRTVVIILLFIDMLYGGLSHCHWVSIICGFGGAIAWCVVLIQDQKLYKIYNQKENLEAETRQLKDDIIKEQEEQIRYYKKIIDKL